MRPAASALVLAIVLVPVARAEPAPAPPAASGEGLLGWTTDGYAVAAHLASNDAADEADFARLLIVAAPGDERIVQGPASLAGGLVRAPVGAPLWLDGQPVTIDVTLATARDSDAQTMTALARRAGKVVASQVVWRTEDGGDDHVSGGPTFEAFPSPDGRRIAVVIAWESHFMEWHEDELSIVVLGPPLPKVPPAAPDARDDLVELRHGRAVQRARLLGFTSRGAAVVRTAWCDGAACRAWLRVLAADGTVADAPIGARTEDTISTDTAWSWITTEDTLLRAAGPLTPPSRDAWTCGGAPAQVTAAIRDRATAIVSVSAGAGAHADTPLAIHDDLPGFVLLHAKVLAVSPAPDGAHAIAIIETRGPDGELAARTPLRLACP